MARRAGFAHNGGMDSVLIHNREMGPRDWAVDVAVALAAFAFGAVQLMVSASLILPDEALRRMLGIEAVIPATSSFIALALTTFPLVARRKSPWLVFAFTLVTFIGLQNSFPGSMLAVFGPMVALFTIVVECSRIEMGVACAAYATPVWAVPGVCARPAKAGAVAMDDASTAASAAFVKMVPCFITLSYRLSLFDLVSLV